MSGRVIHIIGDSLCEMEVGVCQAFSKCHVLLRTALQGITTGLLSSLYVCVCGVLAG